MQDRLRLFLCGAGNRALPKDPQRSYWRGWIETIRRSPRFELVGIQDADPSSLARVATSGVLPEDRLFTDLDAGLARLRPDAVLICPVAQAHAPQALVAIAAGCHVLVEKPFVTRLSDGVTVCREAEAAGVVVAVIQTWRAKAVGQALRRAVMDGTIGRVGQIFFRYLRSREGSSLPPYLFEEPFPLLYAIGVHHVDLFRYVLGENVVRVEGRGFRPPWSRYSSLPTVHLAMETAGGVLISYAGTFASQGGALPQEDLAVEGERGTLLNRSDWSEPPLYLSRVGSPELQDLTADVEERDPRSQYDAADAWFLEDFYAAVTGTRPPLCPGADNLWTLAALEGAVLACQTGKPVDVADILHQAGF